MKPAVARLWQHTHTHTHTHAHTHKHKHTQTLSASYLLKNWGLLAHKWRSQTDMGTHDLHVQSLPAHNKPSRSSLSTNLIFRARIKHHSISTWNCFASVYFVLPRVLCRLFGLLSPEWLDEGLLLVQPAPPDPHLGLWLSLETRLGKEHHLTSCS